jgi:hypothetical protein
MTAQKDDTIKLPDQLISSVDLSRILRELEALDDSLHQMKLRKPGQPTKLARSSVTLEDLARLNKVALTDDVQRGQLLKLLQAFHHHAPRIHMSLAAEPSAQFLKNVTAWLRANVSPVILLEVGLQPTLAAGCVIRTNNKVFDMSLRHRFTENRHMLAEKIAAMKVDPAPVEAAAVTVGTTMPTPNEPPEAPAA